MVSKSYLKVPQTMEAAAWDASPKKQGTEQFVSLLGLPDSAATASLSDYKLCKLELEHEAKMFFLQQEVRKKERVGREKERAYELRFAELRWSSAVEAPTTPSTPLPFLKWRPIYSQGSDIESLFSEFWAGLSGSWDFPIKVPVVSEAPSSRRSCNCAVRTHGCKLTVMNFINKQLERDVNHFWNVAEGT